MKVWLYNYIHYWQSKGIFFPYIGPEEKENLEGAAEGRAPTAAKNTATVHQRIHGSEGFKGGAGSWAQPRPRTRAWKYVCNRASSPHTRFPSTHQL